MKHKNTLPNAVAYIRGSGSYPYLHGQVRFYQRRDYVLIEATIQGLPKNRTGFYGFHIHTGNRCTGSDFADTAGHYSPTEAPHPTHAGDLPPLLYCRGGAYTAVITDRFHISEIIGRTVVIHDEADDFTTQPAGNAGTKIACGVISQVWR